MEVARAIGVGSTSALPPAATTRNPIAYRRYLVGIEYINSRPPGWSDRAQAAFREALAEDPGFAPAYAGLAIALFIHAPEGERIARQEQALEAATRGLELRPDLAETHAAMGLILSNGETSDLEEGRAHLEKERALG